MAPATESSARAGRGRRRLGIRGESALTAILVVAFALSIGGVAMIILLGINLRDGVEQTVRQRAAEATRLVALQGIEVLDSRSARHLTAAGPLQLVDPTRSGAESVVFSSFSTWNTPLVDLEPLPGQVEVLTPTRVPHSDESYSVVARGVQLEGRSYVVLVAGRLAWVEEVLRADAALTLLAVPVLALLGGAAVWLLVGRTLRPVEEIRSAVEGMRPTDLAGRVPEPPTADEIGRLARTMNAMLDRVERSQLSQQRFVADASHELRSPVAALEAGLEILDQHPEQAPGVLPLLRTETRQLARLTDDLLLLARADAGTLRHRRVDVDVDDLVGAEVARLRSAGDLQVEARIQAARVLGDPDELHRMLRNLVDNAARHARHRIGLATLAADGHVLVHIDDDGPGIPEQDRLRVFERFIRLDSSRGRACGGAGLGLAIVHGIVTAHGGTVSVEDSPWGGARFTVRLPYLDGLTPLSPPGDRGEGQTATSR